MILELIHAVKSSSDPINSVTYQKLLSGQPIRCQTSSEKVRVATVLGTLQATLTNFRYLRKIWETNTKEEALLGVSLTGIMDHPVLSGREDSDKLKKWLKALREEAVATNKAHADRLGH
jgi:ribonucleoside-diphosphate reductase alpha chain